MSKTTIVGNAIVVTSSLKLEDLKKVAKYRPKALTLYEDEEPVFVLKVGDDTGRIDKYGAVFAGKTSDPEGHATITMIYSNLADGADIREEVAETFGYALLNLNKIEDSLPTVIEELANEHARILENIAMA
jgi:hypothetical protein